MRLLEKLLNDEISGRTRNQMQAKLFSEELGAVLRRYELKQITSAEVVERSSISPRSCAMPATATSSSASARRRPPSTTPSRAGTRPDSRPELADIARDSSKASARDLTVDWADREATEAMIRAKIKRLLRKHAYEPPPTRSGGGAEAIGARRVDHAAQLVLDQAKALYRYWPDIEVGDRLFL